MHGMSFLNKKEIKMGEQSNGRFAKDNDQVNMKRIQEEPSINTLVHQLCSEMLTIKKELSELKVEIKMVALEGKEVNKEVDSRTRKITTSEEAVEHLGKALLGDNHEKERK